MHSCCHKKSGRRKRPLTNSFEKTGNVQKFSTTTSRLKRGPLGFQPTPGWPQEWLHFLRLKSIIFCHYTRVHEQQRHILCVKWSTEQQFNYSYHYFWKARMLKDTICLMRCCHHQSKVATSGKHIASNFGTEKCGLTMHSGQKFPF